MDALAIVAHGNTHGAISAGQYVYVRGHNTLAEGLYTANSAIAANATLTTSNLTADSGGGLNSLNNKLTGDNGWTTINSTYPTYYRKVAGIVFVLMRLNGGSTPTDGELLGTLPEGYRPALNFVAATHNLRGNLSVSTDGKIVVSENSDQSLNNYMGCEVSYPV
jgi:hypothetical protein